MKPVVGMGSGTIAVSLKIDSRIGKLIRGDYRHRDVREIA
jgi:hypothetical protein